jgi:hypothetical protein
MDFMHFILLCRHSDASPGECAISEFVLGLRIGEFGPGTAARLSGAQRSSHLTSAVPPRAVPALNIHFCTKVQNNDMHDVGQLMPDQAPSQEA